MANKTNKELDDALDVIDKLNPLATFLNESTLSTVDTWIDTGSLALNAIVSGSLYKGIQGGRVTMLAGESMTGKSYIVQKILASAQKSGITPIIFDTENAIDKEGAEKLGLDSAKVKYIPTFGIEECRNTIYKFLKNLVDKPQMHGKFIIAIDSLGNLESEMQENRMEKGNTSMDMGTRARAIKTLLRTCSQLAGLTKTAIIMTNHTYDDPGALHPSIIKNMPGGKSVTYLPSVSIQLARRPDKNDKGDVVDADLAAGQKAYAGVVLRALTIKNRFVKQYLEAEMYLSFSTGLDKYYGLAGLAVELEALVQTGSTYQLLDGTKLGYYSNWRKNEEIWAKILPEIEKQISIKWCYSDKEKTDEELDLIDKE